MIPKLMSIHTGTQFTYMVTHKGWDFTEGKYSIFCLTLQLPFRAVNVRTFQLPLSCKLTIQRPLSYKLTFQLPLTCKLTFQRPLSYKVTFQLPLSCKLTFQLPFSCKLTFQLSFSCKLVFFFVKYFSRPLKEYIYGITPNQFIRSLFLKCFRSALKSHPLWLTLYF